MLVPEKGVGEAYGGKPEPGLAEPEWRGGVGCVHSARGGGSPGEGEEHGRGGGRREGRRTAHNLVSHFSLGDPGRQHLVAWLCEDGRDDGQRGREDGGAQIRRATVRLSPEEAADGCASAVRPPRAVRVECDHVERERASVRDNV